MSRNRPKFEVLCPALKQSSDWRERKFPFAIPMQFWTHRLWERISGRPAHWFCSACGSRLPDRKHCVYVRILSDPDKPNHWTSQPS